MSTVALLKKEFKEQWRTSKALILVLSFFLLGMSGPVTTKFLPEILKSSGSNLSGIDIIITGKQTYVDSIYSYFNQMTSLPVLILVLVAMGAVAGERERGTHIFVLTKPVTRVQFILTKYFTYLAVLLGTLVITGLGAAYYTLILFEGFPVGPYLLLNLCLFSNMAYLLAVIILFSSLFRSSIAAGGASFVFFLVVSLITGLIPRVSENMPGVFASLARPVMAGTTQATELIVPSIIGFVLAGLLLVIACYTAEVREM